MTSRNPQILHAPADDAGSDDADTVVARTKIADRKWLDDQGQECDEEKAVAVSYEFLGRDKSGVSIPGDGKAFVHTLTAPGTRQGMLEGFGALTLMGNITNTWMGDKERTGTAFDAITDRWQGLADGIWVDRSGQVGARLDLDKFAEAVANVFARKGSVGKDGNPIAASAIRARLDSDAEWAKGAKANPEFKAEYAVVQGRTIKSAEELFAGF